MTTEALERVGGGTVVVANSAELKASVSSVKEDRLGTGVEQQSVRLAEHIQKAATCFIPKYSSVLADRMWATSGMVALVLVDDSTLALQHKIEDAGFNHVMVTPMGGDRFFLYCTGGEHIWHVFNDALHFFGMLFNNIHMWSVEDIKYERGAWVRVYRVPIHAWNVEFFKLCVMDVGRYVRADECTVDKARIDFARILISTSSLEIVNKSLNIIVDGSMYSIKLVEEWGCNLGEDTFLTEVESDSKSEALHLSNSVNGLDEVQGEWELDDLVNDLHKEWSAHEGKKEGNGGETALDEVFQVNNKMQQVPCNILSSDTPTVLEPVTFFDGAAATVVMNKEQQAVTHPRSTLSGPWSLERLLSPANGAAALAADANLETVPVCEIGKVASHVSKQQVKKKQPLIFKHSAGFVKRVARMTAGDRKEVIKILKKRDRKWKGRKQVSSSKVEPIPLSESSKNSNSSVNKEWENWVIMHENKDVAKEDVTEIGRAIGLNFNGDPKNSFNLLSKEGRKGWRAAVGREGEGESGGGGRSVRSGC